MDSPTTITRRRLAGPVVLIICGAVALVTLLARDHEPQHQGRSLTEWLREYGEGNQIHMKEEPAEIAVRAIGTNAIPWGLKWIRHEPSQVGNGIRKLGARLPPKYENYLLKKISALDGRERAKNAADLFALLGPDAATAIPQLTRLAATSTTDERAQRCISSLAAIGPDAPPSFPILLTNERARVRFEAASSVGLLRTNAALAVPALIKCLADTNDSVAWRATQTLSELEVDPSITVPGLTNLLRSPSSDARLHVVRCLFWMKNTPRAAEPALRTALLDNEPLVRGTAIAALHKIGVEVPTGPPAH